jgi:predicted nucleotidyltransferase
MVNTNLKGKNMPSSGLTEKDQLALKKFKEAVAKALGDELVELTLFGSKARGDAREDSDVDVLVITNSGNWRLRDVVYRIANNILLDDDVIVSPRVIGKEDYKRLYEKDYPFVKNVIRDGVAI